MKKLKSLKKEGHSSQSQMGMGDYYGTGIRNPTAKIKDMYGYTKIKPKKMGKAPKSLA